MTWGRPYYNCLLTIPEVVLLVTKKLVQVSLQFGWVRSGQWRSFLKGWLKLLRILIVEASRAPSVPEGDIRGALEKLSPPNIATSPGGSVLVRWRLPPRTRPSNTGNADSGGVSQRDCGGDPNHKPVVSGMRFVAIVGT